MKKELLKKKILAVIKGQKVICLATLAGKKPWARFVVSHNHGLILYVATYKSCRKVKEIKRNPSVHALVAKDIRSLKTSYVQIQARAAIRSDLSIRRKLWFDYMKKYYTGIDDPEYVVIEIKPLSIEYWDSEFTDPCVFKTYERL